MEQATIRICWKKKTTHKLQRGKHGNRYGKPNTKVPKTTWIALILSMPTLSARELLVFYSTEMTWNTELQSVISTNKQLCYWWTPFCSMERINETTKKINCWDQNNAINWSKWSASWGPATVKNSWSRQYLDLRLSPSSTHPNPKTCDNLQRQQEKEKGVLQSCFQHHFDLAYLV